MSPRSREEIAELIAEWIADLNDLEGTPLIVVEGKRDRSALSELGISTEATSLNLGLTILELAGSIREGKGPFEGRRYDRAIILTDWDRRGGILARSLKDACEQTSFKCDLEFRHRIARIAGRWVKDVESLPTLLRNLEKGSPFDVGDHPDSVSPGP